MFISSINAKYNFDKIWNDDNISDFQNMKLTLVNHSTNKWIIWRSFGFKKCIINTKWYFAYKKTLLPVNIHSFFKRVGRNLMCCKLKMDWVGKF